MPLEARAPDTFTKDNLLLGFSQIEFTPLIAGVSGTPVPLGILSGQELQKEINVLELNDGAAGTITVAREVLSSLKPSFQFELFNFRSDIAMYVFGAPAVTPQVADAATAITDESVIVPLGANAARIFLPLVNGDVDETPGNLTLTCAPIVNELVGVGDGILGTVDGDFTLAFKPAILGDITRLEEVDSSTGAVIRVFVPQAGEPTGALEAQVAVGATATSGEIDLFQAVAIGNELRADYLPSFNLEEDENAASPDMLLDPLLGRIRFPNLDPAGPSTTDPLGVGQGVLLDYEYNRKASVLLKPFTQGGGTYSGSATIKHLPDIGINFIWNIPSVSIRIDDSGLTFGADDFGVGTLVMNINDAGGSDRFGTMTLADEIQAAA